MRRVMALLVCCLMGAPALGQGGPEEGTNEPAAAAGVQAGGDIILQIGGRLCEYRRADVQEALRRFPAVQQVEFLNRRGTVLVRYRSGTEEPANLADAVERALAMQWGCKVWVERGG